MIARHEVRNEALLFNSNSMSDLLRYLAITAGDFHAAEASREIGHSRSQTGKELDKLRTLGVVESRGWQGRVEVLYLADDELVDAVLKLPALIQARLRTKAGDRSRPGDHS